MPNLRCQNCTDHAVTPFERADAAMHRLTSKSHQHKSALPKEDPVNAPDPIHPIRCLVDPAGLLDLVSDCYWEQDASHRFTLITGPLLSSTGIDPLRLIGRHAWSEDIVPPQDATPWAAHRQGLDDRREFKDFVYRCINDAGEVRHINASGQPVFDEAGRFCGYRGIARDVTAKAQADEVSRHNRLLLESLFESMEEGISVFDADLNLHTVNRRFRELFDFDDAMCTRGTPFAQFVRAAAERGEYGSGDIEQQVATRVDLARRFEAHRFERTRPDGRILEIRGRPLPGGGFVTMYTDITERRVAEQRIRELATRDALTGLPNRVWFSELLNLAIHTARRYTRQLAVLFIDLDRFKIINDTMGHEAGDTLVKEIGKRLEAALRASDVVARLGGDEFVVLLQELQCPDQAATVARKLLAAVTQPVTIRNVQCRVTASIGICIFPDDAQDEQTLMRNADIAMYLAKEDGKNTYQFYSKVDKKQLFESMSMETHLRTALARGEFSLNYQAKLDLRTHRITGVEALLRWHSPELGMVSPVLFIPVAEQAGLLVAIGRWVLKTACEQNVHWQRMGFPRTSVAVNLSACQFTQDGLLADIAEALGASGMDPRLLELEITEGMMIHDVARAVQQLDAIKALGARVAIDDFGTGYSSLAQLKRFPIDSLKIDRSFIRDIPTDPADRAIVEAIIAMAKTLSLTVVAEGVETTDQQHFLRDRGCDEMQGYLFSRPLSADGMVALWASLAG